MKVNNLINARVFVEGQGFKGEIIGLNLPGISATVSEYNSVSTAGSVNLVTGMEVLEGSFTWQATSMNIARIANNLLRKWVVIIYGNLEEYQGGTRVEIPVKWFLTLQFRNSPNKNFSPKTPLESESTFDIHSMREEINGVETLAYDPISDIYRVMGEDMWAVRNANLGG